MGRLVSLTESAFSGGVRGEQTEHGDDHHGADALDLRRLRYFITLAEELHFGRAADRLQIAQPPLSRLIARIEADIGAQLLDRSRSQIRLTQAGKVLLARAREIIRQVDEATAEVAQLRVRQERSYCGSVLLGRRPTAFCHRLSRHSARDIPTLNSPFRR